MWGGREDIWHILTECHYYDDVRDLQSIGIVRTAEGWDLSCVLADNSTAAILSGYARIVFNRRILRDS